VCSGFPFGIAENKQLEQLSDFTNRLTALTPRGGHFNEALFTAS
jgi:hypothetical protein